MRNLLIGCIPSLCLALVLGCGGDQSGVSKAPSSTSGQTGTSVTSGTTKGTAHTHDDWWCDEHGVKEEECSMCSPKVAKACQAKGDWCKEHERAKSQCFICDPKLKEKFAAEYVAKFGKQPPEPEGQKPPKK